MNLNNSKKVSIIIPVYNSAPYLRRCLDSVQNQTYKNLEIICVDDGSTDGSQNIVDEYGKADDRFVVIHKENGGESSARNEGLLKSTGEYIGFMDCDDWIETDMYEVLVRAIENNDVDIAASGWIKSCNDTETEITNKKTVKDGIIDKQHLLHYIYERDSYRGFAYMWDKLYKADLFRKENEECLLFDENLKLGGDVIMLAQLALRAEKAVYINKAFYHYIQRSDSGCHSIDLKKRQDWLKSYFMVIELFEENRVSEDILSYVKRFLAYHSSNVADMAFLQKDKEMLEYSQNIMKDYENEYISLNQAYPERITRYMEILEYKL
ncbi:MAG: glycosyltransferase family 2 protein [Lachnospira sp.]